MQGANVSFKPEIEQLILNITSIKGAKYLPKKFANQPDILEFLKITSNNNK